LSDKGRKRKKKNREKKKKQKKGNNQEANATAHPKSLGPPAKKQRTNNYFDIIGADAKPDIELKQPDSHIMKMRICKTSFFGC